MGLFSKLFGNAKGNPAGTKALRDEGRGPIGPVGVEPKEISAEELGTRLNGEQPPILLDVRESFELKASGSIPGRLHIPMNSVPERIDELDRTRAIVVYCAHGMRSYDVACYLLDKGWSDVSSLRGGFAAWRGPVAP